MPSVTETRDALLAKGMSLSTGVSKAIAERSNLKVGWLDFFRRSSLGDFEKRYEELFNEFIKYDNDVGQFLIGLNKIPGDSGDLNRKIAYNIYASQALTQRSTVHDSLKNLKDVISSAEGRANAKLSLGIAILSAFLAVIAAILVGFQIKLSIDQDGVFNAQLDMLRKQNGHLG